MRTSITKLFTFEAAHQLPNHNGKCARLHGHSYRIEVTVTGNLISTGSSEGMIIDFADISKIVKKEIVDQWDHQFLNEILKITPTAELLATEAFQKLKKANLPVIKVRLWETPGSYAEVVGG